MMEEVNEKRLPSQAREALQLLCGIEAALNTYERQFKPIVSRYKVGWRDLCLIKKKLEQINTAVLKTVPDKQKKTILGQMLITELRMIVKKADEIPTDQWLMDRDDIAFLINKAAETMCIVCDGRYSYKCKLHQIVDDSAVEIKNAAKIVMPCFGGSMLDI